MTGQNIFLFRRPENIITEPKKGTGKDRTQKKTGRRSKTGTAADRRQCILYEHKFVLYCIKIHFSILLVKY